MASDFFPLGRLIFAASITKAADEAQEASREFLSLKCQFKVGFPVGLEAGLTTSSAPRMVMVLSFSAAFFQRFCCSGVYTSAVFTSSPEQTTMWFEGVVIVIS